MITNIKLNNFLSIGESEIELSQSGIDVLIGANGSGKSNFVKALEFISELCRNGVHRAIYNTGGTETILPKSIPKRNMKGSKTIVRYSIELPKPNLYPKDAKPPSVSHVLEIKWGRKGTFIISGEELEFSEPITLARALRLESRKKNGKQVPGHQKEPVEAEYVPSSVKVKRLKTRTCDISTVPTFDAGNINDFIYWFGFDTVLEGSPGLQTPAGFKQFLKSIRKDYPCESTESLIEGSSVTLMNFCRQFRVFKGASGQIRRFDLQLSELRKEQPIGFDKLGREGQYLPAVLGKVDQKEVSFRIKETLEAIAPHIIDYNINNLKTGMEYLEFIENKVGRPAESWSSSDGTLRALAILVILETHAKNQTVIIEEPELCLHPWAIRFLMEHAQNIVKEKDLQVIFTTHSQQVLECMLPDQVIITTRTSQEGTKFNRISDFITAGTIDIGEIGRLWVKGLLGGVPDYE